MKNHTNDDEIEWLRILPERLQDYIHKKKIRSENSYESFRLSDNPEIVDEIDYYRFNYLVKRTPLEDPIQILSYAPLWIRFIVPTELELTVRLHNVFSFLQIEILEDLLEYSVQNLLSNRNLGKKSLIELSLSIINFVKENKSSEYPRLTSSQLEIVKRANNSWFEKLTSEVPEIIQTLAIHKIHDSHSYLGLRENLPKPLSNKIDQLRFSILEPSTEMTDPIAILKIAPIWLLNMDIQYFRTTQRLKGLIKEQHIKCLGDFTDYQISDLQRMRNMGKGSLKQLANDIIHALGKGPPPTPENPIVSKDTLLQGLDKTIKAMSDDREIDVLKSRLGYGKKKQTLESLAKSHNRTRERIRQLQNKVVTGIIEEEYWDDSLKFKLQNLMSNKDKPVNLENVVADDPWFEGFEDNIELLRNIIDHFSHLTVNFIATPDGTIVTDIKEEVYNSVAQRILKFLETTIENDYTLSDVELIIQNELEKFNSRELSDLLLEKIYPQLNFTLQDDELILSSIGNSMKARLIAVLSTLPKPTHYSEIRNIYEYTYGVEVSERSLHAALVTYGIPIFARGTYGLWEHLNIPDNNQKIIAEAGSKIIDSKPEKHWHSDEVLKELYLRSNMQPSIQIDKFQLSLILKRYSNLLYLGKLYWTSEKNAESNSSRLQLRDAIVKILVENGGPIRVKDLRKRLKSVRSVPENFGNLISTFANVSTIEPGKWGLVYRDYGHAPEFWKTLCNSLTKHLSETEKAIHFSEIRTVLEKIGFTDIPPLNLIIGILRDNDSFRFWGGGFFGLSGWRSKGRKSLSTIVTEAVSSIKQSSFYIDELIEEIDNKIPYSYNRSTVTIILNSLGYTYDMELRKWSM